MPEIEDVTRAALKRAATQVTPGPIPLEEIMQSKHRFNSVWPLLAAAVAVLVLGVAVLNWPLGSGGDDVTSATDPTPSPTATVPPSSTPSAAPAEDVVEFKAAADCPVYTPPALPSGSSPGTAEPYPDDSPEPYSSAFGEGPDKVVVNRGREAAEQAAGSIEDFPGDEWPGPKVSGEKRSVVWVGDPPWGTVQIRFIVDSCAYVVFLNPDGQQAGEGFTPKQVIDYARTLT